MSQDLINTESALPASLSDASYEDMAAATGQDTGDDFGVPRLTINSDHEDDNGNKLETGTFRVYDTEAGSFVYSKKGEAIKFRPLVNRYQYMHFGAEKLQNRSVIFADFREDIVDAGGTTKCGRVARKEWPNLPADLQKLQEEVACYRLVYGLVSFTGVTPDGTEVEVNSLPCVFRGRGTNFMPIDEQAFKKLNRAKKLMFNYEFSATTERHKNGSVTYYIAQWDVDVTDPKPIDESELRAHWQVFMEEINAENGKIRNEYMKAQKHDKKAAIDVESEPVSPEDALDADFDDDVPDLSNGKD